MFESFSKDKLHRIIVTKDQQIEDLHTKIKAMDERALQMGETIRKLKERLNAMEDVQDDVIAMYQIWREANIPESEKHLRNELFNRTVRLNKTLRALDLIKKIATSPESYHAD